MENSSQAKLVAIYLPQYHPIPENDDWWGKGFTEWTNVTKAKPLVPNHYQPHLPADLGFYDLRLPEIRQAQADLAKEYGIYGFCYYHYWFNGKRLLERPFNEILASGKPDFPFCLFWANETWSRRWLGEERAILQKQSYSLEDDLNHIKWLIEAFSDPRYIRVEGRPLFIIYRPLDLPNRQKTLDLFRNECIKSGLPEPYLLASNSRCINLDCRTIGFDGTLDFQPQLGLLPYAFAEIAKFSIRSIKFRLRILQRHLKLGVSSPNPRVYDCSEARQLMKVKRDFPTYRSTFVAWDNTPRRGKNSIVIVNSTPENFESSLQETVQETLNQTETEPIVFLNAWNEWAEGNHLEPDLRYGRAYLEAVKRIQLTFAKEPVDCYL